MSHMAPRTSNDLTGEHIPRVKGTHTLEIDNITCTDKHTRKRKSAEYLATVVADIHGQTHPLLHKEQTATIFTVGH